MKAPDIDKLFLPEEELKKQNDSQEDKPKIEIKKKVFKPEIKQTNFIQEKIDEEKQTIAGMIPEETDSQLKFIREIIGEMKNLHNPDTITELNDKEILLFARLELMEEVFGIPELKAFAISIYRKKLSRKRGLRKEMLQAISQSQPQNEDISKTFPELLTGSRK